MKRTTLKNMSEEELIAHKRDLQAKRQRRYKQKLIDDREKATIELRRLPLLEEEVRMLKAQLEQCKAVSHSHQVEVTKLRKTQSELQQEVHVLRQKNDVLERQNELARRKKEVISSSSMFPITSGRLWPPTMVEPEPATGKDKRLFADNIHKQLTHAGLVCKRIPKKLMGTLRDLSDHLYLNKDRWSQIDNGNIKRWFIKSNFYAESSAGTKGNLNGNEVAQYVEMMEHNNSSRSKLKQYISKLNNLVEYINKSVGCTDDAQPECIALHVGNGSSQFAHMDTKERCIVTLTLLDPARSTEVLDGPTDGLPNCWSHYPWKSVDFDGGTLQAFRGDRVHRAPEHPPVDGRPRIALCVIYSKGHTETVFSRSFWKGTLHHQTCADEGGGEEEKAPVPCPICPLEQEPAVEKTNTDLLDLLKRMDPGQERFAASTLRIKSKSRTQFPQNFGDLKGKLLPQLKNMVINMYGMKLTSISYLTHYGPLNTASDEGWHVDTPEVSAGANAMMVCIALDITVYPDEEDGKLEEPIYTVEWKRRTQDEPELLELRKGDSYVLYPSHRRVIHKPVIPAYVLRRVVRIGGEKLPLGELPRS